MTSQDDIWVKMCSWDLQKSFETDFRHLWCYWSIFSKINFFRFLTSKKNFVIFVDAEIQNFVDFRSNFSRNVFYYIISLLEKNANNNSTKFWKFSKKCKKKSKNAFQHKIIIFLESVVFVVFVAFLLLKCCSS